MFKYIYAENLKYFFLQLLKTTFLLLIQKNQLDSFPTRKGAEVYYKKSKNFEYPKR